MEKKEKKDSGGGYKADPNAWMTTFADLLMLLLTFFVLLLTMKSLDGDSTSDTFQYFIEAQGPLSFIGGSIFKEGSTLKKPITMISGSEALEKALELMGGIETPRATGQDINKVKKVFSITEDMRGVVVSLESSHLFNPGEAEIRIDGLATLDIAARLLRNSANDILVMGHTDNIPVGVGKFKSNWELSFQRALSVLFYLSESGGLNSERLAAGGFGGSSPRYPNTTKENRAKNRRVEFILRKPA